MIVAGVIAFNEGTPPESRKTHEAPIFGLLKCLQLFKLDRVIVIDGAFKDYPHEAPYSTDDTFEIVESFKKQGMNIDVVRNTEAWESEAAKRTRYFEMCDEDDWLVIVDADDRLVLPTTGWGHWLNGEYDCLQVITIYQPPPYAQRIFGGNPRIIHVKKGMHYKYNHYSMYDAQGRMLLDPPYRMGQSDIMIAETPYSRKLQRVQNKTKFWRTRREQANGREIFCCADCHNVFRPKEGDPQTCPRCNGGLMTSLTSEEMKEKGVLATSEDVAEKAYCKKCGRLTRCGSRDPLSHPMTDGGYYWCSQCGEVTAKWSDKLRGPVDIETGEPVLHGVVPLPTKVVLR